MNYIPAILFCCIFATAATAAEPMPNHPPVDHRTLTKGIAQDQPAEEMKHSGKVVNVINVSSYVYLEVDTEESDENIWIALPDTIEAKEGDMVHYNDGPVMKDFTSRSLNRTFESIIFLSNVVVK